MISFKFFFPILFVPFYLAAQNNYVFQHLTVEDGLLENSKLHVFQDAQGFYWFSELKGIQRFDGKNFIFFNYNYSNKTITSDWTCKPLEDEAHNIWIINQNGINIFRRKKQILSRLYMADANDSDKNNVVTILKDSKNMPWVFTNKNVFTFNSHTEKFLLVSGIAKQNSNIAGVVFDKIKNGFWIYTSSDSNKIFFLDCISKQINYEIKNLFSFPPVYKNPLSLFAEDSSENLWLATYYGDLYKYNIAVQTFTAYTVLKKRSDQKITSPNSALYDCFDDSRGSVWFAADYYEGLLRYNKMTDSFTVIPNNNGSAYGLHYDKNIYSFYEDRENNIWVNTDLGMNVFNEKLQQFKYIDAQNKNASSSFSSDITSIYQSSANALWISTWGDGVFEYDSNFVFKKNYVHAKNDNNSFAEPFNRAWNFAEDKNKNLWIGCQQGMLSVLNIKTGKFINKIPASFANSTVMRSAADNSHNIWFGLYKGIIAKLDAKTDSIKICAEDKNLSPVDGLCVDSKNNVWIGAGTGLYCYTEKEKLVKEEALTSYHILSVRIFNDSLLIGGTSGNGFFLFNTNKKTVQFFNSSNNISSNIIYGGVAGKAGDIWIVADNGVERMNVITKKIYSYDISDGIKDHVFERAMYKMKNGTVLIATNSGVMYFNVDSITQQNAPPNVVITSFKVNQKPLSVDSLLDQKNIDLKHDENALTIDYASVSFTGRNTDQYFYKLEGVDKTWIEAGTKRSVTYANLSSGNYFFYVKAVNRDGIETLQTTSLYIIIHPAWWRTWWAYFVWFVIICLIVYFIYDYRKRSAAALSAVRQHIANDLHDDIGSTLNSISVYSEIASRQLETNSDNTKDLLKKMGSASRNMIDTMNDIVWTVNPKNDQFENILQRMQYFAGELLSGKNILLQFEADDKLKNIKLDMIQRKNFYLIFKEAINNAYKYSFANVVTVSISAQQDKLVMNINDNGKGFEIQSAAKGNGLNSMRERAQEINASLNISSVIDNGTSVELKMPLK